MKNDITEDDVKKVWDNSINLSFEQIFADLDKGKLPHANPIILSNGYGVGMSLDYYNNGKIKRNIRHIYVSNPNGKIDPAIADMIASRILGDGYTFIEPMSIKGIFHYIKEETRKI